MAIAIISTNTTAIGTAATISVAGDDLYLVEGVRLVSTAGFGVEVTASDTTTHIDGTVIAASRAYLTNSAFTARLFVGETGSLTSFNSFSTDAGVVLFGTRSLLDNRGLINSPECIGSYLSGSFSEVVNTGSISGTTGIQLASGGDSSRLINHGDILGSGMFDGTQDPYEGRGVLVQAGNAYLYNGANGLIGSTAAAGTGIHFADNSGGGRIENHGDIVAQSGTGINLVEVNLGQAQITVLNFGTISGEINSFFGSENNDLLTNRGLMIGQINTFFGDDVLDNRGGTIEGGVLLGFGNDRLDNRGGTIAGNVNLGDWHDVLDNRGGTIFGTIDGGLGNDTFLLGVGIETINGGTGTDAIDFRGTPAVVVSLDDSLSATGHAVGDVYVSIETVYGSFFGDHIVGSASVNNLRGYDGVDTIDGGAGNDVLSGGKGADVVTGGAGSDVFLFGALNEIGDTITDFSAGAGNDDVLQLRGSSLGGGLALGVLAATAFQSRADNGAQDATDRFIFRTTDRTVWFDVDGNGSRGPVLVADLQAGAVFDRFDIVII